MERDSVHKGGSRSEIIIGILELLDENTDREHGVTAAWLADQLGITVKTIRGHLYALREMRPFGRKVDRIERGDLKDAESPDPRPGWYIEPVFDTAQMRLLADGAALSRSDGEYIQDLVAKIYAFAGRSDQLGIRGPLMTPKHYNREFLNNIERLNDAIAHERGIRFHYCTYDVSGELVPRLGEDGRPREYAADPYDLRYKNEKYYLICHLRPYDNLAYLHVERIRDLMVDGNDHTLDRSFDSFTDESGAPIDLTAFMDERPYPSPGPAIPVRLRVEGGLEPVFDWFPDAQATQVGDSVYEVTVKATPWSTIWWALQYTNSGVRITVLEPESIRAELRRAGHILLERYE
ncbi:DNA-binding protein [Bifidobacterium sp. UTCIF-37]|uniref:helix-turn-helix transcriptional regulator n=1 Tax=unclassified Bifidobacterium TaxID=2608897 RepID=UPI00112CC383|nr:MULTISPECIES: WYL domain-containing transcriptional regulator [unclassified Bifidobacterium]TPF87374.1 DNA-binding protein [Bifidobacterium sp. UTCIF-37]TPF91150.1 DNA-binding protein [Bifidobacterium sp. UTCIF-38]